MAVRYPAVRQGPSTVTRAGPAGRRTRSYHQTHLSPIVRVSGRGRDNPPARRGRTHLARGVKKSMRMTTRRFAGPRDLTEAGRGERALQSDVQLVRDRCRAWTTGNPRRPGRRGRGRGRPPRSGERTADAPLAEARGGSRSRSRAHVLVVAVLRPTLDATRPARAGRGSPGRGRSAPAGRVLAQVGHQPGGGPRPRRGPGRLLREAVGAHVGQPARRRTPPAASCSAGTGSAPERWTPAPAAGPPS